MGSEDTESFIGRHAEIAEVIAALPRHCMTLLLGPGGAGKTTLARVVLSRAEGVDALFCDLSSAKSADDVVSVLGTALGLTFESRERSSAQLRHALEARGRGVVVLDNLEGLTTGAQVLLQLLDSGPSFLGTSRTIGPFTGAHVLELGPLAHEDGVRLFVDRARRILRNFNADDATHRLVERLDGSPLAIELAAGRVRTLSPAALLERFGRHLDLLRGGDERPSRHRSLRAVVEGSWALCGRDERHALLAASLFKNGFDLAAAESLLGDLAAEVLERLLESSLLRVAGSTPSARFRLSESVRDYADERLSESPDARAELERRFASHYREVARRAAEAAESGDRDALATLAADAENLATAFRLDGRSALAFDMALGRTSPAETHMESLIQARTRLSDSELEERAELEVAIAQVQRRRGDAERTLAQARRAAELAERADRGDLVARAALLEAAALYDAGRHREASVAAERAAELARARAFHAIAARSSSLLAFSAMELGDLRGADRHGERAMSLARAHGLTLVEFNVENLFGAVELRRGRLESAEAHQRRGLTLIEGLGLSQQESMAWGNLGNVLLHAARYGPARDALTRALDLSRRAGLRRMEVLHHVNLGKLEADLGALADARARAVGAEAMLVNLGSRLTAPAAALLAIVALLERRFEDAAETLERALGQQPPIERDAARASLRAAYAAALALSGRISEAHEAITRAREVGCEATSVEAAVIAAHTATVHFACAQDASTAGEIGAADDAQREGMRMLALSEPRGATSVDVRLARACALANAASAPAPQTGGEPPPTSSARVRFELVSRAGTTTADAISKDADLAFDAVARLAVIDGRSTIDLRRKPLAAHLLEVLLREPNKRHEKAELYREVWQAKYRSSAQAATLYKAVDRLARLLDDDPRRFLRWDEAGALVLVAKQPALLRAPR